MKLARRTMLAAIAAFPLVPAWSLAASEQARIAFLEAGSASANAHFVAAFRNGMRSLGYEEGKSYVLDVRWADGRAERFPELLSELTKLRPDVFVVASSLGAVAAHKAVTSIPVVFVGVADPVAGGYVQSLAHPGGNMTGLSRAFGEGLLGKALELLREIVPSALRVAVLYNPEGAVESRVAEAEQGARSLGMTALPVPVRDLHSLDGAFATMRTQRADALLVIADPLTLRYRDAIAKGAAANRLPGVYEFAEFARAGGLIAYSASVPALFERAAIYVDKILKGANPGELPVEQPTQFDLVINQRAAKALGLMVPQPMLLRANEVIQ